MLDNHIPIIAANLINLFVAILVFSNNPKRKLNILYLLLAFSLMGWTIANEFSVTLDNPPQVFLAVQWVMVFVVLQNYLYVQFINIFPDEKSLIPKTGQIIFGLYSTLVLILAVSKQYFSGYTVGESGSDIILEPAPAIGLFALHALISVGLVLGIIFMKKRQANKNEKQQLNLILFASFILYGLVPATAFVSPVVFGNNNLVFLAPIYILIFVLTIAYAMYEYKLFDIRSAIAKTSAYSLILGAMMLIFVSLVFGATLIFFDSSEVNPEQFIVFAFLAVFLAFTYQPLKKFFDRLTDEIFYRQSYDSEEILTEYSDFLVDEVETERIVNHTLDMLNDALNPELAYVVLYMRGMGVWYDSKGVLTGNDRDAVARALEYQKTPIMDSDVSGVREDEFTKNIKEHLVREGLRISVKLSTHGQLEGFVLLGGKKSGSRYSPDDHSFLSTVANELSVSLQNSERFDEIQQFNETLREQIDAATKQLRESNRKLQTLDQAKDEFISMASHQLRTPLTSVKGYVSMVMDGDAGPVTEDQKRLLGEAFASSQRMVYLISDLLNVSRLKTGKFVIEKSSIYLPKIVDEEVSQLIPSAQTRNLTLSYAPPTRFPELMLDETKTRQVIMNFIDNAIYYTKSGGQIDVNLRVNKKQIEYRVKDSGIGVPARDQHKLFTKFFRARNARSARPDGTGLGLYMAQKIITAQGGTIYFESKEGKGSEFGFNLPLSDTATSTKKSSK